MKRPAQEEQHQHQQGHDGSFGNSSSPPPLKKAAHKPCSNPHTLLPLLSCIVLPAQSSSAVSALGTTLLCSQSTHLQHTQTCKPCTASSRASVMHIQMACSIISALNTTSCAAQNVNSQRTMCTHTVTLSQLMHACVMSFPVLLLLLANLSAE